PFLAADLLSGVVSLGNLAHVMALSDRLAVPEENYQQLLQHAQNIERICRDGDLETAAASATKIVRVLQTATPAAVGANPYGIFMGLSVMETAKFKDLSKELSGRVQDALSQRVILELAASKAAYFDPAGPLFGDDVDTKFPTARYDIDEAGKSFALGRY